MGLAESRDRIEWGHRFAAHVHNRHLRAGADDVYLCRDPAEGPCPGEQFDNIPREHVWRPVATWREGAP